MFPSLLQTLIAKSCRLYNVFGSGASHAAHAQFIAQSSNFNKGRRVGLLRGASTRFATWFYAMMRILRQKDVLRSTIHTQKFLDLPKNETMKAAVKDISNDVFFRALFVLLRAVFPALRALRFTDSNTPMMDKIHYFTIRTQLALEKSVSHLNDEEMFGKFVRGDDNLEAEIGEVWG